MPFCEEKELLGELPYVIPAKTLGLIFTPIIAIIKLAWAKKQKKILNT